MAVLHPTHTQRWQKDEVTVRVCVTYKSYRHHRHGKRCQKKLVFAAWRVHGQPTLVREWYRKRFAIEASYRQLGQARIRTSTRDPLLRLYYVGVALLLRNVWEWLRSLVPDQRASKRFLFRRMLQAIARWINQSIPAPTDAT